MSELDQAFKKAKQTFTHASEFVVPLYEDAYLIAEDLSDEIAAERNLNEQDYEAQQLIENEIEGAVAFFGKIAASFLAIQLSLLEDCLLEICEAAVQDRNLSFRVEDVERFSAERARLFFEQELNVRFPIPWPTWEKVLEFQRLRDQVIKHGSLDERSINISDRLLVDINETMGLFFEELQNNLLQNSDAG